jgi:hypothetical protein
VSTATKQYALVRKPKGSRSDIRRRVRHVGVLHNVYFFACYSMSHPGSMEHKQEIDLSRLSVRCSCMDFLARKAHYLPTVHQPEHHCKHIRRCVEWLQRHELLPPSEPICVVCGVMEAPSYFPLATEQGEPTGGMICSDCIKNRK